MTCLHTANQSTQVLRAGLDLLNCDWSSCWEWRPQPEKEVQGAEQHLVGAAAAAPQQGPQSFQLQLQLQFQFQLELELELQLLLQLQLQLLPQQLLLLLHASSTS